MRDWIRIVLAGAWLLAGMQTAQAGLFDDLKSLTDKTKALLTAEPSAPAHEATSELLSGAAPTSAEPQAVQPEQADTPKAEKQVVKTPKSYSLFHDQGDHLTDLIKAGQFEDAEQLFMTHKAGFFDQAGGLDRKPRMEKYAAELRQLADALNAPRKIQLKTLSRQLLETVEAPHSEARWAAWRASLQEARSAVAQYRAHPLLGLPIYQDASLSDIESAIARAEQHIQNRAIEVVLQNPPDLAASWLTHSYPVHIDINNLVNRQSARVLEMLSNKGKQDVVAFHRIFGNQFGDDMLRNVGDLLLDKHDLKGVGDSRLRQAMKAYQDVKALGLKPSTLRGLRVLYAERANHNELKFGSRLHPDIPLPTQTIEFDSLSGKLDGNFLIILDIKKSEVQRKEGGLKRVRSQYLSGHRNIPNPQYAETKAAYERARSTHDNANSQNCSYDRGMGCAIAKTILVATAGASMAEAQKKVYSTPEFLSEPIYRNYDYRTSKMEVKKTLSGKAYFIDLGALMYQVIPIELTDSTSFPLVHDLSAEDTQHASIVAAHKSEQDIDHYADQPMEIKLSTLVDTYLGEGSRALSSLDQLMTVIASGGTPVTPVAAAPLPIQHTRSPPVAEVDDSIRKLQAELLAQRQQLKVQAQRERLEAELARLKESSSDKFNEDLQEKLTASRSAQKQPNLHVLAVGINNYADVPDVPFAERSAQLFAELAKKALGANEENVLLLTDADATSGRLRGRLRTLLSRLGENDRLIIYYAGHGVPAKDGKSAYLLAQDGGPGSFEEPDLQLDALYAQIEKSGVGQASVFIDACFSGRSSKDTIVFKGVAPVMLTPKQGIKPNGRISVITAGRSDQFSNQDEAHGHRLFGYHLMKALLEDGPHQTTKQLHAKLRDRVLSDSKKLGPEFEQEPEFLGNAKGVVRD